jgi:hypothetical protein
MVLVYLVNKIKMSEIVIQKKVVIILLKLFYLFHTYVNLIFDA